ncbi:hypothetical protein BT69DRAFT_180654 [Atractiella rhizophila]|nr:hypothetical protein BT69DRAFT_180654 [Atractiella rhizophila]
MFQAPTIEGYQSKLVTPEPMIQPFLPTPSTTNAQLNNSFTFRGSEDIPTPTRPRGAKTRASKTVKDVKGGVTNSSTTKPPRERIRFKRGSVVLLPGDTLRPRLLLMKMALLEHEECGMTRDELVDFLMTKMRVKSSLRKVYGEDVEKKLKGKACFVQNNERWKVLEGVCINLPRDQMEVIPSIKSEEI